MLHFLLIFALSSLCMGFTTTLPIRRTTLRYKFDDWRAYNGNAGAFRPIEVCVSQESISFAYGLQLTLLACPAPVLIQPLRAIDLLPHPIHHLRYRRHPTTTFHCQRRSQLVRHVRTICWVPSRSFQRAKLSKAEQVQLIAFHHLSVD